MIEANYVDLQVNGYVGVDFNDPAASPADIRKAAAAMRNDGIMAALPTVITASREAMLACIKHLRQAIECEPQVAEVFPGLHLEGPFLSRQPGFIGAHPPEHAHEADVRLLGELLDACGPYARLMTLAPEVDRHAELTAHCTARGVHVAAGHTDAGCDDLERCIEAGLSLFTHLGNGCPRLLDRHDNIILRALSYADRLSYSVIADSFHVPELLFRLLLRWLPPERLVVVSDAISATGLGPGTYRLGARRVRIGPDKAARDASGEHFVGAASSLADAERWLREELKLTPSTLDLLLSRNAQSWIEPCSSQARC